jgi:hypothetical protein
VVNWLVAFFSVSIFTFEFTSCIIALQVNCRVSAEVQVGVLLFILIVDGCPSDCSDKGRTSTREPIAGS